MINANSVRACVWLVKYGYYFYIDIKNKFMLRNHFL